MNKTELLAALQADDFDREAILEVLKKEAQEEAEKKAATAPFRERPSVRVHLDEFNRARQDLYQPAIYRKSGDDLAVALKSMVASLEEVAAAAGVTIHDETPVEDEG
jgi:hypothetical protein